MLLLNDTTAEQLGKSGFISAVQCMVRENVFTNGVFICLCSVWNFRRQFLMCKLFTYFPTSRIGIFKDRLSLSEYCVKWHESVNDFKVWLILFSTGKVYGDGVWWIYNSTTPRGCSFMEWKIPRAIQSLPLKMRPSPMCSLIFNSNRVLAWLCAVLSE